LLCPLPECNLSYANGIWLADLDADAWKLKVHHGFVQPLGTVGSLALFTPPRDEAGREKWQRHQNYAGHILSEEWQKQPNGTYRWVPEGYRSGHLRSQRANHYLDAIHRSSAKRLNRTGGEPFTMRSSLVLPYGTDKTRPAETLKERRNLRMLRQLCLRFSNVLAQNKHTLTPSPPPLRGPHHRAAIFFAIAH